MINSSESRTLNIHINGQLIMENIGCCEFEELDNVIIASVFDPVGSR